MPVRKLTGRANPRHRIRPENCPDRSVKGCADGGVSERKDGDKDDEGHSDDAGSSDGIV